MQLGTKSTYSGSRAEVKSSGLSPCRHLLRLKAFTARSIAGLIDGVGLLTKSGIQYLAEVFKDFENREVGSGLHTLHSALLMGLENPNYKPANPNNPFPNKPSAASPRYMEELSRRGISRTNISVKVVGVFDTVGK